MTQEKLKELFEYNKETGNFTRLKSKGGVKIGTVAGRLKKNGYVAIGIDNKEYYAHRLAWLFMFGYIPEEIDHKNRVRNDNRIDNLREVTSSINNHNRDSYSTNTSGCSGVCFTDNRWRAYISIEGKKINLGRYINYSDAVNARKNAEVLYGACDHLELV